MLYSPPNTGKFTPYKLFLYNTHSALLTHIYTINLFVFSTNINNKTNYKASKKKNQTLYLILISRYISQDT